MQNTRIIKYYSEITPEQLKANKILINRIALSLVKNYKWNDEIGGIATNLIYYFNGIEHKYDLNKSIALAGAYGVGKTVLMKIFQEYLRAISGGFGHPNIYRIVSIEDVINAMSKENFTECDLLYNYHTELDRPIRKPANLMINEFGFKYNGKSYGTEFQELIEIFLMKRYDIFQEYGKLTHVTMNFDTKQLKQVFPEKITDRFKEMFNIIPVAGSSHRK